MPMSWTKAAAICSSRLGCVAFLDESRRDLLLEARLRGLPAEPAEHEPTVTPTRNVVGAPRNAVAVRVARIGARDDDRFGYRLEEPQSDHLRRHARPHAQVLAHGVATDGAVAGIDDLVARRQQLVLRTVGEATRDRVQLDPKAGLGQDPEDGTPRMARSCSCPP
jgi:hypothetical protein